MRWSICQAVIPLTTTVSTSAGSRSAGTGTRARASTSAWVVQAPIFVTVATRRPTSAGSTSAPAAVTVPSVTHERDASTALEGVVRESYYLGAEQRLEVEVAPGRRIVALRAAAARPAIDEGETVMLGWDSEDVVVLAEAA